MKTLPQLTTRQQQVLDVILKAIQNTGAPPTRAEIAQSLGFRSANAAEEHLRALARKGAIELVGGTSRGIRLKADWLHDVQGLTNSANALPPLSITGKHLPLNLPLIGRVAAGSPILAQEHVDQIYTFHPALFSERPDYLLRVRGMSMRDAGIWDGDLLAVRRTSDARNGQIVVARIDNEVTVKRFQRTPQGISLHAENPEFPSIEIPAGRPDFSIEGRAVGLIRASPMG